MARKPPSRRTRSAPRKRADSSPGKILKQAVRAITGAAREQKATGRAAQHLARAEQRAAKAQAELTAARAEFELEAARRRLLEIQRAAEERHRAGGKRQRNYKAEYKRRLKRGKAAGKTRQWARGHRPGEARTRRERERQRVEDFAIRQMLRWKDQDADKIEAALWERIKGHGFGWFSKLERLIDELHALRIANRNEPLGIDLDDLALEYDLPREYLGYN